MGTPDRGLFPSEKLLLPPIREGETLYSWCAHYHVLTSNSRSVQTSRQLFGHPSAALRPDFPICLDALVDRTGESLGTSREIIFRRTPFGIFARFLAPQRIEAAIESMTHGSTTPIPQSLGLTASGLGPPAVLKACPKCIEIDFTETGTSRWILEHQLPGVSLCSTHRCLLRVATNEAHARARKEFCQPHRFRRADWQENPFLLDKDLETLQTLSAWSCALALRDDQVDTAFNSKAVQDICHLRALNRGWICMDGTLRFKQIRDVFLASHGRLSNVPTLRFIEDLRKDSGGFLGLLMHRYEGFHHPLMYLVLLTFLFESLDDYTSAYKDALLCSQNERRKPLTYKRDAVIQSIAMKIGDGGMSVNRASDALGLPVGQAISYLKENGISYKRRPHIVGTDKEIALIAHLQRGDDPNAVAAELSIRRGYIKDYLASRPELRKQFESKRLARRRQEYRTKFLKVLADNPSLPIKRIRQETNSGFQWLYYNDRVWLEESLPGLWHRPKT